MDFENDDSKACNTLANSNAAIVLDETILVFETAVPYFEDGTLTAY